jgi:Fur family ferric uptake transcriptional regulator
MTALKSTPAVNATGIEARCAATGMRMTEQRRVIARVLAEAVDHPDVDRLQAGRSPAGTVLRPDGRR